MCDDKKNGMFIVRKPEIALENDKLYEKAKEASSKLPCPQATGGHKPMAMKTEHVDYEAATFREPWGWSFVTFKKTDGKTFTHFAYFCECCHSLYFVEVQREEKDGG